MKTKKNILLVDDDKIVNFLNKKVIEGMGLANEVHTATNGEEALKIFNQYFSGQIAIPDVVLLDLSMPVMDGFEFMQAFNELNFPNKEKVLVIVLTSSNDPLDRKRAKALGVKHYLTKPISEEMVKAIIIEETS